METHYTEQFW